MRLENMIVLDRDEVNKNIAYALICETRYGKSWNGQKRMSRWMTEFTDQERSLARSMFRQAYRWYLVTGVPEEVRMKTKTLVLWNKLAEFCASL